ncbi:MAG: TetR family transcriptional regulator C-terminal domain-containing protein [Sporomusaceae bacterium]|nr:TetR family transcriptional regulator C-terminal domain-containing protein [Sporomusaceae bacterium]
MRRKSSDLEKTKQQILEAGLQLLQEKGYNATGIQDIASAAKIPKGSFYNYFANKEAFGAAVIRYYTAMNLENWLFLLQAATAKADSYQALSTAFLSVTEKYRCEAVKKGCLLGTMAAEISEVSEECRVALHESIAKFKTVLADHLADGQQLNKVRRDISSQALADLVWDCWQGSLLRMKVEKSVEAVERDLETLFHHLLLP